MCLGPARRSDFGDLPVGHLWQAAQHFAQVGVGIDLPPPAALDEGVEDRTALAGSGFAHEEPVFLAQRRRPDRVLDQVMPPPDLCRVAAQHPGISPRTASSDDCGRGIIRVISLLRHWLPGGKEITNEPQQ